MSGVPLPPLTMSAAGPVPQAPLTILDELIAIATALATPGFTANLPGSLIEDMASTGTAGVVLCDQARDDAINSIGPTGANAFVLAQLGQQFGIPIGAGVNTSVSVVFSGPANFVIDTGIIVSDGTYQYSTQEPVIIGGGGQSQPVTALATQSGAWPVPPNTVNQIIGSPFAPPYDGEITVDNPFAGTPATGQQTEQDYRAQITEAFSAVAQGFVSTVKTFVRQVSGVQTRLISVRPQVGGGWAIIVGGGDIVQVAGAINRAVFDPTILVGSLLFISNITKAGNAVATTFLNHGYSTGQVVLIENVVGMTQVNGYHFTITVLDEKNFELNVNSTTYGAYVSGGVVTPNFRNVTVPIVDDPDVYPITFVQPPQQSVELVVTWLTDLPNFTLAKAVNALGAPAIVDYVNSILVGAPILLDLVGKTFTTAVADVLAESHITGISTTVSINGIPTAVTPGTLAVYGDAESYFFATPTSVVCAEG